MRFDRSHLVDVGRRGYSTFHSLARDEQGATAIEYGIIAGSLVIAIITALYGYGDAVAERWNWLSATIMANMNPA